MAESHAGSSDVKSEPNLTPLLDMVLQLVMFFMLVANFTMEQVNVAVKLPTAQSARPADKSEAEVLYLNINDAGKVVAQGFDHPLEETEVRGYLTDMFKEAEEGAKKRKQRNPNESDEVKTVIIIRGDKSAEFKPIYNVLRHAKAAGFKKWQLRVNTKTNT
jgi:biopolymer transport protein ExbD